jgi:AmmeMemoRadiSam system protein A
MSQRFSDLSSEDGAALIAIARRAISSAVIANHIPDFLPYPLALRISRGVFVTLYRNGRLRGCVGQVEKPGPLAEMVAITAVHAALHDPRFPPVGVEEVPTLGIELSVLSPLELITRKTTPEAIVEAVIVGQHGLMVVQDRSRGLLLPQVATDRGWSGERFLEETCEKAGLPRNAWRDPSTQVFTFTAELFSEAGSQSAPNK